AARILVPRRGGLPAGTRAAPVPGVVLRRAGRPGRALPAGRSWRSAGPAGPQGGVAALPVPLLDLPAGGRPAARPLERGDRRLRPGGVRAPPGRGGDLGRVRVPAPDPV